MVITTINGSPKMADSKSEQYLSALINELGNEYIYQNYMINKSLLSDTEMKNILKSNIIIFAFPLYVDGIPSNLLRQMILLEEYLKEHVHKKIFVYVIINNGFYEGEQNEIAIQMMKNFCKRVDLIWGQGIGIGAGEMQGTMLKDGIMMGKGPLTNLGRAMSVLIDNIKALNSGDNLYVRPNIPWFLFKVMAKLTFWDVNAKKNGISKRDLVKRFNSF